MIKQFLFRNFRNFENIRINIENLSVLIGANAAGKTNVIEGIRMLSYLAKGDSLDGIFRGGYRGIRGRLKDCMMIGRDDFSLGCVVGDDKGDYEYEIIFSVNDLGTVVIWAETIKIGDDEFRLPIDSPLFAGLSSVNYEVDSEKERARRTLHDALVNIFFLSPDVSGLRGYAAIDDNILVEDCTNLAAVLYKLYPIKEKQIMDILRNLPDNEIKELSFREGSMNDVVFFVHEKLGKHGGIEKISSELLSDGTLKSIALLAAALSSPKGSLIVTEDPDTGIHSGRLNHLIQSLVEICNERGIDLLLTTHSVQMLNSLKKEQMTGINFLYRNDETGTGCSKCIMDIQELPLLLLNGKVGDLVQNNKLEKSVKGEE